MSLVVFFLCKKVVLLIFFSWIHLKVLFFQVDPLKIEHCWCVTWGGVSNYVKVMLECKHLRYRGIHPQYLIWTCYALHPLVHERHINTTLYPIYILIFSSVLVWKHFRISIRFAMSVGSFCGCLNLHSDHFLLTCSMSPMGKSSSFHQNLPQKMKCQHSKNTKTAEKVWHVSLKAIMSTHLRVLLFAGCASGPCQRLAKGSSWKKRGGACQKQRRARVASERSRCGPRWKKGDGKKPEAMKVEDLRDVEI